MNYVFVIQTTVHHFKNIESLQMNKHETTIKGVPAESGKFGPIYRQFAGKPKEAIKFLREKKTGECIAALHRIDIGVEKTGQNQPIKRHEKAS